MQAYPDHKGLRVIAFNEQQLELVDENAHELQLHIHKHKTRMDRGKYYEWTRHGSNNNSSTTAIIVHVPFGMM